MTGLTKGVSLYKEGKYNDALEFFLTIPNDDDQNSDLAYYMGLCYAKMLQYDNALLYLEQVITGSDDIARIYQCRILLAVIYVLTGRKRLADFELRKLIEMGYESTQVFCVLGYIAWEQGRGGDAEGYYERALKTNKENATAANGLGYILGSEEKDLTRALSLCKQAVEAAPDNAAYLDSLGWVYYKIGMTAEARAYLKRAAEKLPNNAEVKKHLAAALKREE